MKKIKSTYFFFSSYPEWCSISTVRALHSTQEKATGVGAKGGVADASEIL